MEAKFDPKNVGNPNDTIGRLLRRTADDVTSTSGISGMIRDNSDCIIGEWKIDNAPTRRLGQYGRIHGNLQRGYWAIIKNELGQVIHTSGELHSQESVLAYFDSLDVAMRDIQKVGC